MLYSMEATPRPRSLSSADNDTVTGDLYQPGMPGVPDTAMVVVGAMVSGGAVSGDILTTKPSSDPAYSGCGAVVVAQSVESVWPVMIIASVESSAMPRA